MRGNRRTAVALALLSGLTLLAGACSGSGAPRRAVPPDAQRLTVTLGDSLSFDQPALVVQSGRPVAITVRSTGRTDHDFTITGMPAEAVRSEIQAGHGHARPAAGTVVGHPKLGSEVTIQFVPTTPGTYEFYCSVSGHREAGMRGTLTVT